MAETPKTLAAKMAELDPERRAAIEAETKRLRAEIWPQTPDQELAKLYTVDTDRTYMVTDEEIAQLFEPYNPPLRVRIAQWFFFKYVILRNRIHRRFFHKPSFMNCDRCGRPHELYTTGQAYGLCSSVDFEVGKLRGHYGSRHDLSEFDVIDPDAVPGRDICDDCIDELAERGALKYAGEYNLC